MAEMTSDARAALDRLLLVAMCDSGQARRAADFLLAWWNPDECGRFNMLDAWGCDMAIADDMVSLFSYIAKNSQYPDALGYGEQFDTLVARWRPDIKLGTY